MVEKHTNYTVDDSEAFGGSGDVSSGSGIGSGSGNGSGSGEEIEVIAGFSAGDHYYNIPRLGTADVVNIAQTSNVGIPGIWIFNSSSTVVIIRLNESVSTLSVL